MNKKTIIVIMTISVIIIAGASLYFSTTNNEGKIGQGTSNSIQKSKVGLGNYQNEKYGFSLTFNNLWDGYQVVENISAETGVTNLNVCVPTQSSRWTDIKPGVYCPIIIKVVQNEKWEQYQKDLEPLSPTFIAKNSSYVFAYSTSQDSPDEAGAKIAADYANIVKTFKLNK